MPIIYKYIFLISHIQFPTENDSTTIVYVLNVLTLNNYYYY